MFAKQLALKLIILSVLLIGFIIPNTLANLQFRPPQDQNSQDATSDDSSDSTKDPTSSDDTATEPDDDGCDCSKVNPKSIEMRLPFGAPKDRTLGSPSGGGGLLVRNLDAPAGYKVKINGNGSSAVAKLVKNNDDAMGPYGGRAVDSGGLLTRTVVPTSQLSSKSSGLISPGAIKLKSSSPSPKLFSPQGLQYDFAFESSMAVNRYTFTVRRPNGYDIEYDATGVPTGSMEKSHSRMRLPDGSTPYNGKILPDDEVSEWSPPETYQRTFPDGSKAIFTRYTISSDGNTGFYKASTIKTAFGKELESTDEEIGVEVIRDEDKSLKQIKSSTDGLTNIEIVDQYKYKVKLYNPEDVGSKQNGVYQIAPEATPREEWTIENPQRSETQIDNVKITKTAGGVSKEYNWEFQEGTGSWKVSLGSGAEARTSSKSAVTDLETNETLITSIAKDSSDNVKYKKQEVYEQFDFGKVITEKVIDPDGAALKTEFDYNTNSTLKSKKHPDGLWEKLDYDASMRRTEIARPLKNAVFTASSGLAKVKFAYVSHDNDDTVVNTDSRPRTTTREVDGTTVSKSFLVDKTVGTERIVITEIAATPTAAYGAASNLRTTTVYDTATARLKSVTYPNGKKDTYTYDKGNYTPGSEVPGSFSVNANGDCLRETIVHGTTSYPNGIAYKTTKEIIIHDELSDLVLKELYAYDGSNYNRISWEVYVYDSNHHLTNTYKSNNTETSATWNCCNKESEILEDGTEYTYTYDSLDRVKTKTKKGISGSTPDVTITYTYDSENRLTSESVSDGTNTITTSTVYDVAGRVTSETDASGLTTSYSYTVATSTTGNIVTTTYPDGGTKITEYYFDGRVKSITGTAVVAKYYDYGVEAGTAYQWTKESIGSAESSRWTKTYINALEKDAKVEKSGYNGSTVTIQFYYNNSGQLYKRTQTGLADTLYEYDSLGNLIRSGLDINDNGSLDLASSDRISESENVYSEISSDWWVVATKKTYATTDSNTATTTSVNKIRLTGLASGTVAEIKSYDINNNETTATTTVNRTTKTVTETIGVPNSSVDIQTIKVNGLVTSKRSASNLTTTYAYDDLERRTGVTDPRTGTITTAYYTTGIGKKGKVYTVTDADSNTTTYDYNTTSGRLAWVENALSKKTYYDYNTRGQVTNIWGDTDYPVEKAYDSYGQMTSLKTYRAGTGWTGSTWPTETTGTADTTTWTYDASSGLVTAKAFADSESTSYTYTTDGKIYTRTWARTSGGNPLTTTYSYDSNTGEQTGIDYSDSTQDITISYTRTGQQYQVTDAVGTRTFAYNTALLPTTETISGGLYSKTITRDYAASGVVGRNVGFHISTEYDLDYGYDTYGRFSTITDDTDVYTYAYVANSELIASLTYPDNIKTDYTYEANRNLITQVTNTYDISTTISQYDYTYDDIGRRDDVDWSGTAFSASDTITYGYNDRSEVTSADATTDATYNFAYNFDNIGNRSSYTTYETGSGVTSSYTLNSVNQYTAITNPAQSPTYDDDGNMTDDGTWDFTWNAENRLIAAEKADAKLEFKYDYMGRRVEKKVYSGSTGNWTLDTHLKFVYDGYNQIEVLDGADSDALLKKRIWGVNKLVCDIHSSTPYYAVGDANKNITEYLDDSGNIKAHYEYSPFGKITNQTGTMPNDFDFRFSSEYLDAETGLVYYNYRYYSPQIGRWLSRDPIEEKGGYNLYAMVYNRPVSYIDSLGLNSTVDWVMQNGSGLIDGGGNGNGTWWQTDQYDNIGEIDPCPCANKNKKKKKKQTGGGLGGIFSLASEYLKAMTEGFFEGLNPAVRTNFWADAIYNHGHGTLQIGGSGTAGGGSGVTLGDGIVFGYDLATGSFEVGAYGTAGMGSYMGLGASFTLDVSVSNNRSINDLRGTALTVGGSGTAYGVNLGGEVNIPMGSNALPSVTVSGGAGVGSPEAHVYVTHTVIEKVY